MPGFDVTDKWLDHRRSRKQYKRCGTTLRGHQIQAHAAGANTVLGEILMESAHFWRPAIRFRGAFAADVFNHREFSVVLSDKGYGAICAMFLKSLGKRKGWFPCLC